MKKLIIVIIGVMLSGITTAQTDSSNKKMSPPDINYNTSDSVHQYREKYNNILLPFEGFGVKHIPLLYWMASLHLLYQNSQP